MFGCDRKSQLQTKLFYTKAIAIEESMSNAEAANTVACGDLSEDPMKVSDVTLKLGDREKALEGYHRALRYGRS